MPRRRKFGGVQLAIDATLVSPLHCGGSARRGAVQIDGAVFEVVLRRKERIYIQLVGRNAPVRLVVLSGETGSGPARRAHLCVGQGESGASHLASPSGASVALAGGMRISNVFCRILRESSRGVDGDVPPAREVVHEFRPAGLTVFHSFTDSEKTVHRSTSFLFLWCQVSTV